MARIRTIHVLTDGTGAFSQDIAYRGQLIAVQVATGDLSTPDLDITDEPSGTNLLSVNAIAEDTTYYPMVASSDITDGTAGDGWQAPAVFGRLTVAVTGGGNAKSGTIKLLLV